jgi:hypothetical protein
MALIDHRALPVRRPVPALRHPDLLQNVVFHEPDT